MLGIFHDKYTFHETHRDAANGKAVFQRICSTCHEVGDIGINFGPALSEIGGKLPKDALYTSIFDPNAGISFGFEGYELKLREQARAPRSCYKFSSQVFHFKAEEKYFDESFLSFSFPARAAAVSVPVE